MHQLQDLAQRRRARVGVASTLALVGALTASAPARVAQAAEGLTDELAVRIVGEVLPQVERLRGLEFKQPVPVSVIDDAGAREQFMARVVALGFEEQLGHLSKTYELLGLIPPGTDLYATFLSFLEQQAGGFYDPEKRAYYLLDDAPPALARIFTAHELTHALEDQYFDLDKRIRSALDDDDRMFALSAVHEGSATLLMSVYMVEQMLAGKSTASELQSVAEAEEQKAARLSDVPAILLRQLLGPYILGVHFLTRGNVLGLAEGYPVEDVGRAYRDGPRSSEQILHPEKYWGENQRDEPIKVELRGVGRALGKGWRRAAGGTLGELGLGPLVGAGTPIVSAGIGQLDAGAWTNAAAAGWGGDRWELWHDGPNNTVVLLTVWDSPEDAEQFDVALAGSAFGGRWLRAGERVAVVAGALGRRTPRVLGRLIARSASKSGAAAAVVGSGRSR